MDKIAIVIIELCPSDVVEVEASCYSRVLHMLLIISSQDDLDFDKQLTNGSVSPIMIVCDQVLPHRSSS